MVSFSQRLVTVARIAEPRSSYPYALRLKHQRDELVFVYPRSGGWLKQQINAFLTAHEMLEIWESIRIINATAT